MDRAFAARCALLALAAERMTGKGDAPELDPIAGDDWEIVGYVTAANALFGTQQIGLGSRCYYGFVAQSKESPWRYAVVIRGTASSLEWLEDAEALFIHGPKGCVAHGFWSIYSTMQYGNQPAASAIASFEGGIREVVVIGHSLGSALATYLMADIKANAPKFVVTGALFASPKPGDGNYAHYVDAIVGRDNYTVFNYSRDIVPRLPFGLPFGLGFQALPNVIWITPAMSTAVIPEGIANAHSLISYARLLDSTAVAEAA